MDKEQIIKERWRLKAKEHILFQYASFKADGPIIAWFPKPGVPEGFAWLPISKYLTTDKETGMLLPNFNLIDEVEKVVFSQLKVTKIDLNDPEIEKTLQEFEKQLVVNRSMKTLNTDPVNICFGPSNVGDWSDYRKR